LAVIHHVRRDERQEQLKFRTAAWRLPDRDLTTMHIDGPFGDGQSQPSSARIPRACLIDSEKAVKDAFAMRGVDARALIGDRQDCLIPTPFDANGNRGSGWAVLDRIIENVGVMAVGRVKRNLWRESWVGAIATVGGPLGRHDSWLAGGDFTYATSRFRGDKNFLVGV
jgi:hypothetical protein